MWCDAFDMDLPRAVPEAMRAVLAVPLDVTLRTFGHLEDGTLNHPASWNTDLGATAFFTLDPHDRPAPAGYVCGYAHQVVTCTFAEAVRDAWVHDYVMVVDGHVILDIASSGLTAAFDVLMRHRRGWRESSDEHLAAVTRHVVATLEAAAERMVRLVAERRMLEAAAAAGFGAEHR